MKPLSPNHQKNKVSTAKECALISVFVSLVIAAQIALSAIPGVEIVTVLFVVYSFSCGAKRGMLSATAFSILRQIVFGFFPTVLILYLIYYNLLTLTFGLIGKKIRYTLKWLPLLVVIACVYTVLFTLIDNVLTPLWYGYGRKAAELYFIASLTFVIPQVICTAVSVSCLFIPLYKIFDIAYKFSKN